MGCTIRPAMLIILKDIETAITLFNNLDRRIDKPINIPIPTGARITKILIFPIPLRNIEDGVNNALMIV
jgi:hypothetical protein